MIPLLKLRPRPNTVDATTVDGISSYIPTSKILIPLLSSSSLRKKKETATAIPPPPPTTTASQLQQRAKKRVRDDPPIRSRSRLPMMSMMPPSTRSTTPSSQQQQQPQQQPQQQQQQQPQRRMTLALSQVNARHSFVTLAAAAARLDVTSVDGDRDRCDGGRKRSRTRMMMIDPQQEQNEEEEQRDKKNKKLKNSIAPVLFTPPPQPPLALALLPMKTQSIAVSTPVCTGGEVDKGYQSMSLSTTMLQVVTTSAHVDRKKKEMVQRPSFLKLPSSLLSVSKSPSPLPSVLSKFPSPPLSRTPLLRAQLKRSTMMCTSYDEDDDNIGECDYTHDDDDAAVHRRSATTVSTTTKSATMATTTTATKKTMMPQAPVFLIRKKGGGGALHRMKKQTARSLSLGKHHRTSLSSLFLTPPIVLDETRFLMQEMVS